MVTNATKMRLTILTMWLCWGALIAEAIGLTTVVTIELSGAALPEFTSFYITLFTIAALVTIAVLIGAVIYGFKLLRSKHGN